jgi:transcriptional regulator with XRE-family HTH domain
VWLSGYRHYLVTGSVVCQSGGVASPIQFDSRRRELSGFLRSRRERITPDQVGLIAAGRRRTPGLRREEVAQLAGVGVTWYTWLEQGRDINVSEQVLDAIASTLRLDPSERSHLFTLAGAPEPAREKDCRAIPPGVHAMLAKLNPFPAVVVSGRTDILAYNESYDWLMDVSSVPVEERNMILLLFTNPAWRARLMDWEDRVGQVVGQLRGAWAGHVGEPAWKSLIKRLRRESSEFDALWRRHDVQPMRNMTKRFRHPDLGVLNFDYTYVWLGRHSEVRMTTYTPADAETTTRMNAFPVQSPRDGTHFLDRNVPDR